MVMLIVDCTIYWPWYQAHSSFFSIKFIVTVNQLRLYHDQDNFVYLITLDGLTLYWLSFCVPIWIIEMFARIRISSSIDLIISNWFKRSKFELINLAQPSWNHKLNNAHGRWNNTTNIWESLDLNQLHIPDKEINLFLI